MTATDEICRVSIRAVDREVDVVLPGHVPVVELIPAVVDLVGMPDVTGAEPRLVRVSGEALDPAATLTQCAIPHGELLLLTTAPVQPRPIPRFDTSTTVIGAVSSPTRAAAVRPDRTGAAILGVLAVALAGLTAALAAPGALGLPAFLLAMSAMAATSLLSWRLLGCAPAVFLPTGVAATTASAITVGAVAGWWPTMAVGPVLALVSLALLTVSARWSVRSSGLSTAGLTDGDIIVRTRTARHRLTVLVVTAAEGATLGAVVTLATTTRPLVADVFVILVGSALVLRGCRQIRRWRLPLAARRAIGALDLAVGATVVPCAAAAAGAFTTLPGLGR